MVNVFGPGILIAAGVTVVAAVLDKTFEEFGFHWVGIVLKVALPLAGLALGVYFLETNPINWWLR
jgi:hypothetical protein